MANDVPLFEGWIHTLLCAYGDTGPLFDEIAYWAPAETRSVEVDFLLQRGGEHLALEVKAGARFAPAWLSGLTAIGDLPRLARRVLVYTGTRELRTPEGIEVWPLAKLLTALAEGTLWP
jgi:predicted AAA+ superfamily ATPase